MLKYKVRYIFTNSNIYQKNMSFLYFLKNWLTSIITAFILLQTLYFKFSGHKESVELFTKLHVEPWGRILTGIIEVIIIILLLIPQTRWIGAILSICVMAVAILSHIFILGISTNGDKGTLFILAWIALISSIITLIINWKNIPFLK